MENSEDVLKIDKKLVTTKRGSCDQFLAKIKFSEPGEAKLVPRVLVLVAGLLTFQVQQEYDVNSRNMIWNKEKISTRKHSLNGALYVLLQILFHFCPSLFLYFWAIIVFWDSLTLSFYFLIFFFTQEHKRSNHRKYELKQVKGVACGKFKRRSQN